MTERVGWVVLDVPPNPELGGSALLICETLLDSNRKDVNLLIRHGRVATGQRLEQSRKVGRALRSLRGVNTVALSFGGNSPIVLGPSQPPASLSEYRPTVFVGPARYETPAGMQYRAAASSIRRSLRFSREVEKIVRTKLNSLNWRWTVVVHGNFIKETSGLDEEAIAQSKGLPSVWKAVIESWCQDSHVGFLIIGDDAKYFGAGGRSRNWVTAGMLDMSLTEQLCAVQVGGAFLGMSTGPSTFAILSSTPYIVLKHPKHHATEMQECLGANDQFVFATSNQYYFRKYPDKDSLTDNVRSLVEMLRP